MAEDEGFSPKAGYHHGDLGRSLVTAAVAIIAESGVDALTLRGVGERLGVSRTALYRHYRGKGALLAAVAREGFHLLRGRCEAAIGAADAAGADPIVAIAEAYVAFGREHPPHYQTMFGPALGIEDWTEPLQAEGRAAFGVLVAAIAVGQGAGRLRTGDPVPLAQVLWATVHGIVTLGATGKLDGPSPASEPAEALTPLAARVLLDGLATRPAGPAER